MAAETSTVKSRIEALIERESNVGFCGSFVSFFRIADNLNRVKVVERNQGELDALLHMYHYEPEIRGILVVDGITANIIPSWSDSLNFIQIVLRNREAIQARFRHTIVIVTDGEKTDILQSVLKLVPRPATKIHLVGSKEECSELSISLLKSMGVI